MKTKKLSQIAIEEYSIIDRGGTQSDYNKYLNYIKTKANYPNKEIKQLIEKYGNKKRLY